MKADALPLLKIAAIGICIFAGKAMQAQGSAYRDTAGIPEVVIRGTLKKDTLRRVPASVAVLDAELLRQNDGTVITSLINQVPGVYMQQGALNTNRITVRGIGARSQYSTNRVKAYVDGIPVSTAAGTTVIEDIDLEVTESVEILKGPASSIYGTGLGGVINLFTKKSERPAAASAGITVGSFGLVKQSLSAGIRGEHADVRAAYQRLRSDGFRENMAYDRESLTLNGGYRIGEKTDLRASAILTRMKGFIPSSLNETDFNLRPDKADENWNAAAGFESYDRLIAGIILSHRFNAAWHGETTFFTHIADSYEPRPFDILDESRTGFGSRTLIHNMHRIGGRAAQLTLGGEYIGEHYRGGTIENRYREFPGRGSIPGEVLTGNRQQRDNLNLFAQHGTELSERWHFEVGLNLNSTAYSLEDLFATDSLDQSGNYRYGAVLSPRAGLSFEAARGRVLYTTVSHGFSAPGVEETLTPSGEVNTDLRPETGVNYETGIKAEWLNKRLYTEAALYTADIRNLLVARRIGDDRFIGINAGAVRHTGVEIYVSGKIPAGKMWLFRPYFTGSLHRFRFTDFIDGEANYSGNPVTGVPDRTANLGIEIERSGGWHFRVNALHVGAIPLNDANTAQSAPYTLINLRVAYETKLFQKYVLTAEAGINNAADTHYAASILPNAQGFGGNAPRYFYPGEPRSFWCGLRVGF